MDNLQAGQYLEDLHPGAGELYADTNKFVGKCFSLRYRANNSESVITGFDPVFRGHIEAIVAEERDKITGTGLIDSILVKINENSSKVKTPTYVGHSALNFDCVIKATKADYDPLTASK